MNSLLSEIFAKPRDREDFIIALVVLGLFGGFILTYALPDTPQEVDTTTAFITPDELDMHLIELEESEVRPEPRRVLVDEDIEEVREENTFIKKEAALPATIATIETLEEDVTLDIAPSTAIETDIFDDAVAEEETPYIEEEEEEAIYEEDVIEDTRSTAAAEITEKVVIEEVQKEEIAVVEEKIQTEKPVVPSEFNTKGSDSFDCLIIVGAFKIAENANVIISQLEKDGYAYKKIDNKGFTCVGIPMNCSDKEGIAETKAKMKAALKVDPWVMRR